MNAFSASAFSTNPPPSDAELARAAQRGEKRAFVEIVARHQVMVCGVALGVLGDFTAGEDAAQEAFVTAWRKIQELREPEKLKAWLAQIARNAALGHLRRRRGVEFSEVDEEQADEGQPLPDQQAAGREESVLVREALAKLPENYRMPLVLFYRQDQSVREVAETLRISEDAVKQRLARGRELLRERMSGLIENALRHTQPGAVFTIAIAAAIGALAAPSVLAGSAFAAAAAVAAGTTATAGATTSTLTTTTASAGGSSAAGATTASATVTTVMTTSKASLLTAALVAFACLPVGYAVHQGTHPPLPPAEPAAHAPLKAAAAVFKADFGDSGLFAEWHKLHEEHGHDAEAMPVLFKAIADIKDTFRRRAFRSALIAEWAEVDPAGGLSFLLPRGGDRAQCRQLFQDWLARDPQAAMAKLTSLGKQGDDLAGEADILKEIARRSPESIAAIAARLPENRDHWSRPVTDAFAILAAGDLDSARAAAEGLSGPRREEALAGVAKAWARKDFKAAADWVKALPESMDREGILRSALMGVASADPKTALENVTIVPPGGRPGYFADTTGAKLLKEAGEKDFDGTVAWLRDHPGKISPEDTVGLANIVTGKLNADPVKFLDQAMRDGTLATLNGALGSALLNEAKPQLGKVWDWLKKQPDNEALKSLRDSVINSAGWQDAQLAMAIAKEQPDTPEGAKTVERLAQSLVNGGQGMNKLESLLPEVPAVMRGKLLAQAFNYLTPDNFSGASRWLPRLNELPAESRAGATQQLAQVWAVKSPGEAAAWSLNLPAESRAAVVGTVANGWLKRDSLAASEWIATLPAGPDRDAGAGKLVEEVADDSPAEAWQWAVSIGDSKQRVQASARALAPVVKRDPGEAQHWIDQSALTEPEKQQLRQSLEAGAAAGSQLR